MLLLSVCITKGQDIALDQVLAWPRHFNGKHVAVTGSYVAGTEVSCLFKTRDVAKRFDIALDSIAGHQASLVGTFHYKPQIRAGILRPYGHNNLWSVALLDVTEFRPLK